MERPWYWVLSLLLSRYRIFANSFRNCMYCDQRSYYIRLNSKKNSFRGNCTRKYGIHIFVFCWWMSWTPLSISMTAIVEYQFMIYKIMIIIFCQVQRKFWYFLKRRNEEVTKVWIFPLYYVENCLDLSEKRFTFKNIVCRKLQFLNHFIWQKWAQFLSARHFSTGKKNLDRNHPNFV